MTGPILTFLGAAGTVTGSRFLIDTPRARLLVDCGLFQGLKEQRLRNWEPFPVEPASIDAVLLTHAHVDHVGYLPALHRAGFAGPVFAVTPSGATSAASVLMNAVVAARAAVDAARYGIGWRAPIEVMASTRPQWFARMPGTTALTSSIVDKQFSSSAAR